MAYNAIHTPHEVPEEYLQRFAHVKSPTRQPRDRVAAMAAVMDEGVGEILAKLRQHECVNWKLCGKTGTLAWHRHGDGKV